jgi:hypothetical protein
VVGAALLDVAREKVEDYFLTFNQFSFTQDGPQVVYNLIRHALATHPDWVVLSGDERSAFHVLSERQCREASSPQCDCTCVSVGAGPPSSPVYDDFSLAAGTPLAA